MAQILDLKIIGLYTSPNTMAAPQGSFEEAENVVINNPGVLESRRGQTQYGEPLPVGDGQVDCLFNYKDKLIANYNDHMAYDSDDEGTWIPYDGYFFPASEDYRMKSMEAMQNFYFTTSTGVQKIDLITNQPRESGVIEALSGLGSLSGGSGFLLADSAVAYRLVWSYVDANNNLVRSAPSNILIVANSTGTDADVSLTYLIPDSITTAYKYSIYRSNGTAAATDIPDDELQLVLEENPTANEIFAKAFTVIDSVPYSQMGEFIYTAPSQGGIKVANYQPPLCTDMDLYKNFAFYANTTGKQQIVLTLLTAGSPGLNFLTDATVSSTINVTTLGSISSTAGLHVGMFAEGANLAAGTRITRILTGTTVLITPAATATGTAPVTFRDYVSINDVKYFAGVANDVANNIFKVETAFTIGDNINFTAQNLVDVVNRSASNTSLYGYYESGGTIFPGQMRFKARDYGMTPFELESTSGSSFVPALSFRMPITLINTGNPPIITTYSTTEMVAAGSGIITIEGTNSTPSTDGDWNSAPLSATTFFIVSAAPRTIIGTTGTWIFKNKIVVSSAERRQNTVFISKDSEVEAVPLLSSLNVGSANYPIDRIITLRDGLHFYKKDGIFKLTGDIPANFSVTLIDGTTFMNAPETAVPFNNQVHCVTTQGVCAVTDSVDIISIPIETEILTLSGEQFPNFREVSFAVAYESSRQYILFTNRNVDDGYGTQAFVYNYLDPGTWTRWGGSHAMNRTCGIVNSANDKLYMAKPDGQIVIERKQFSSDDYADEQYDITLTEIVSTTQLRLASVSNLIVDMMLVQNFHRRLITSIDGDIITIASPSSVYVTGAAVVYTPIFNKVTWNQINAGNPAFMKHYVDINFLFKNASFDEIVSNFTSNVDLDPEECIILNNAPGFGWGTGQWGLFPWGEDNAGPASLRTLVPPQHQRCQWLGITLELAEPFSGFALEGISVQFNPMSLRIR